MIVLPVEVIKWEVKIDCHHDDVPAVYEGAATWDFVAVEFYTDKNVMVGRAEAPDGVDSCGLSSDDKEFTIWTTQMGTIKYVIVKIYGGNSYAIDHIYLEKDGDQVKNWGTDNGAVWCLSTDDGKWFYDNLGVSTGGCFSGVRFDVSDGDAHASCNSCSI
jgi:hypothetical protein